MYPNPIDISYFSVQIKNTPLSFLWKIQEKFAPPNDPTYICVKDLYADFINGFVKIIYFDVSAKANMQITCKANSKPWFDSETK